MIRLERVGCNSLEKGLLQVVEGGIGGAVDAGDGSVDGCRLVGDVQQHDRLGDKSMARQRERVCV